MTTNLPANRKHQNGCTTLSHHLATDRSPAPSPSRSTAARSYFRSLRAAEMTVWEVTGGDFALARFVHSHARARN
jgi:hypothetical protein